MAPWRNPTGMTKPTVSMPTYLAAGQAELCRDCSKIIGSHDPRVWLDGRNHHVPCWNKRVQRKIEIWEGRAR
jgi:hypothetical protein